MKLRNKLLTALPLSVIGLSAPIAVSSCSCGQKTISITFGDELNCHDKNTKSPSYQTSDIIKASSRDKIQVIESGEPLKWQSSGKINQQFYWDLVYSGAYYGYTYVLTGNKWTGDASAFTAKFNGTEFNKIKYENKGGSIWMIACNGDTEVKWLTPSFTYHLL